MTKICTNSKHCWVVTFLCVVYLKVWNFRNSPPNYQDQLKLQGADRFSPLAFLIDGQVLLPLWEGKGRTGQSQEVMVSLEWSPARTHKSFHTPFVFKYIYLPYIYGGRMKPRHCSNFLGPSILGSALCQSMFSGSWSHLIWLSDQLQLQCWQHDTKTNTI